MSIRHMATRLFGDAAPRAAPFPRIRPGALFIGQQLWLLSFLDCTQQCIARRRKSWPAGPVKNAMRVRRHLRSQTAAIAKLSTQRCTKRGRHVSWIDKMWGNKVLLDACQPTLGLLPRKRPHRTKTAAPRPRRNGPHTTTSAGVAITRRTHCTHRTHVDEGAAAGKFFYCPCD